MTPDPHPCEDVLERYCLGTLPVVEIETFEEHLLVCGACQDRLRETERYVKTMQAALTEPSCVSLRPQRLAWVNRPAIWLSGAAALLCLFALLPRLYMGRDAAPLAVTLELTRGGESTLRARAPAGRPLLLRLDGRGVPVLPAYRIQIVDARGNEVFQSPAAPSGTSLTAAAPGRLARGLYWVRLCEPAPSGRVLREFGLELR